MKRVLYEVCGWVSIINVLLLLLSREAVNIISIVVLCISEMGLIAMLFTMVALIMIIVGKRKTRLIGTGFLLPILVMSIGDGVLSTTITELDRFYSHILWFLTGDAYTAFVTIVWLLTIPGITIFLTTDDKIMDDEVEKYE